MVTDRLNGKMDAEPILAIKQSEGDGGGVWMCKQILIENSKYREKYCYNILQGKLLIGWFLAE